jgi:hypothetical protein
MHVRAIKERDKPMGEDAFQIGECGGRLQPDYQLSGPPAYDGTRGYIEARVPGWDSAWGLRVHIAGAVALVFTSSRTPEGMPYFADVLPRLERAWNAAADVLLGLGAHDSTCLSLVIEGRGYEGVKVSPRPTAEIAAWVALEHPSPTTLEAIKRELVREAGGLAWEPE